MSGQPLGYHFVQEMASFTFTPTPDVPVNVLSARSTYAKIKIEPIDAFVDAAISCLQDDNHWKASASSIPQSASVPLREHKAVLMLSKGELGSHLGSIDLGNLQ